MTSAHPRPWHPTRAGNLTALPCMHTHDTNPCQGRPSWSAALGYPGAPGRGRARATREPAASPHWQENAPCRWARQPLVGGSPGTSHLGRPPQPRHTSRHHAKVDIP